MPDKDLPDVDLMLPQHPAPPHPTPPGLGPALPGLTAMLTMYNVKKFLEEGEFESTAQAQQRGVQKQSLLVIGRCVCVAMPWKGLAGQREDDADGTAQG